METVTLPISLQTFWGIVFVGGFVLVTVLLVVVLPKSGAEAKPLTRLKSRLGLSDLHHGLFFIAALMWGVILILLFAGLLGVIWDMLWSVLPASGPEQTGWRFTLTKLAALTAVLVAVVAFPVTLTGLKMTRLQTRTAEAALFNDKINSASDDLHAMRQRWDGKDNIWEADVVRRNAAIDRLEGLVREQPDVAPRIARMLSVYVREMSKEVPPEPLPQDVSPRELRDWARGLPVKRSDMHTAVHALGRLRKKFEEELSGQTIDLSGANLQAISLSDDDSSFEDMLFEFAQMQGAYLIKAQMQGTNLIGAKMQGAFFYSMEMNETTRLIDTSLKGAAVQSCDLSLVSLSDDQIASIFGDASVTLPGGVTPDHPDWPAHFPKEVLENKEFFAQWRAWQAETWF